MIVGVVGAGGGVGTSTLTLLLGAALSTRQVEDGDDTVVLEADISGGVFGARYELGVKTGVGSWVSALFVDSTASPSSHGRLVLGGPPAGLRVLPAPQAWPDASKTLTPRAVELVSGAMAADRDRHWAVDLGRGGHLVAPIVVACDLVVVVVDGGSADQVVRLPAIVTSAGAARRVVVAFVGSALWPLAEVAAHASAPVVGGPAIDGDPAGLQRLVQSGRRRDRNRLWRLACEVLDHGDDAGTQMTPTPSPVKTLVGEAP